MDKKGFREKVRENLKVKNFLIQRYYKDEPLKVRDVVKEYGAYRECSKKYAGDNVQFLHKCMEEGKSILFEGAQGAHLDVDHGTYPSSRRPIRWQETSPAGQAAPGARLRAGGLQGLYDPRREGPFPTELTGPRPLDEGKGRGVRGDHGQAKAVRLFDAAIVRRSALVNGDKIHSPHEALRPRRVRNHRRLRQVQGR